MVSIPKTIKSVIFDLDGVLIDATEWHYEALNKALGLFGYTIDRESHLNQYNGLPTKKKLNMLTAQKGFPRALHHFLYTIKQQYTKDVIYNRCRPDFEKQLMLAKLKEEGYRLVCCSNSIRESVEFFLRKSGTIDYFEFFMGNDEGFTPKPDPAMYNEVLKQLQLQPHEAVIVEDAPHGIAAAKASGAHTCEVTGYPEVNYSRVRSFVDEMERKNA